MKATDIRHMAAAALRALRAAAARMAATLAAAACAIAACAVTPDTITYAPAADFTIADSLAPAEKPLRPVTTTFAFEAGSSRLADTYLSPMRYSGYRLALDYTRQRAMAFSPRQWMWELRAGIDFDNTAYAMRLMALAARVSWGMTRKWQPLPAVTVGAGGRLALNAGCLYMDRGGNNPASARADITLDLTALAAWRTRLGRLPVTLTYQGALPVTGAFFSPDYGELYYEIYLGDHRGLAHAAWSGNFFALDTRVAARLELGGTSLTVGYHGTVRSTHTDHLTTRAITHAFTFGVCVDWLSVAPSRAGAGIITPY